MHYQQKLRFMVGFTKTISALEKTMSEKITNPSDKKLVVLRLGAAHGLRGEMKATSFTEDPSALKNYGALTAPNGTQYVIKSIRQNAKGITVNLDGIVTREQAEALNGVELSVSRSILPDIENEDDFYYADLIGLTAINLDGVKIGDVLAVHDFGAGDILELRLIKDKDGKIKQVMIPFSKAAVPHVDIKAANVTVDEDIAGLKDNKDEQSKDDV